MNFRSIIAWRAVAIGAIVVAGSAVAFTLPAAAETVVKVELWDKQDGTQGMRLSTNEVKAGEVTFEITNTSTIMEHEFLYVKTDLTADEFPMKDEGAKVAERKLDDVEEFGDIEEGDSDSWTVDLTPGNYVLFCNEEGHFAAGMHTTLTVLP